MSPKAIDDNANANAKTARESLDPLHAELRQLRYADPSPELRRRTLAAAGEVLGARESSGLAGWWRELALAGAALLLFNVSLPTSFPSSALPAFPAASSPIVAQVVAENAELADQLGLDGGLAAYLEKKSLTEALAELSARSSASRFSTLHDPS